MNFSSFDRAAKSSGSQFDSLSQNIDSQLSEAQKRHQERLASLQQQYLDEQQQILEQVGSRTRPQVRAQPKRIPKPKRNGGPPQLLVIAALAFLIAKVLAG